MNNNGKLPLLVDPFAPSMVEFLTKISCYTGAILTGEDEGGDDVPSQITIGSLGGRWWFIIEEDCGTPIIGETDGTEEGTRVIWFHEDAAPFAKALIGLCQRYLQQYPGR